MVFNRTFDAAIKLAKSFNGIAYQFEELPTALIEADIVISSTSSGTTVIDKHLVEQAMKHRRYKTLFMIDIAVPRDIDPAINNIENVYLYDIDNLQDIVDANLEERKKIANQINNWIDDEVYSFYQWINTLGVIPLIVALRDKSFKIQEEIMKSIENKLPSLNEKELTVIRKHTKSIVNQMLKDPILRVKEMAVEPDAEHMMNFFKKIFAISVSEIESNPIYEDMKKKESQEKIYKRRLLNFNSASDIKKESSPA